MFEGSTPSARTKQFRNVNVKIVKVGDLVVYCKDGFTKFEHPKAIWKVIDRDLYDNIKVEHIVSGKTFITGTSNLVPVSNLIKLNKLNKKYIIEASLNAFTKDYGILNSREGKYFKRNNQGSDHIADSLTYTVMAEPVVPPFDDYLYNEYVATNKNLKKEINKVKDKKMQIVDDNAEAAKIAAKITVGKTLNSTLIKKVKPQLPMLVRGYTDSVLADVVIANIANFAVQNFFEDNEKAVYAADAMMQAAMVEFMSKVNIEEILSSLLSGVSIPDSVTEKPSDT